MRNFENKVVLVTGASGGIGLCTTKLFAENGAKVVGTDIVPPPSNLKSDSAFFLADATDRTQVVDVVKKTTKLFGQIDVLVNNAGVGANLDHQEGRRVVCENILEAHVENIHRLVELNTLTALWFIQTVVPHMPKSDSSCVIAASSIWSKGKLYYALPYSISKAAMSVMALSLAHQIAPIRSVAVVLGGINTPMLQVNPRAAQEVGEQTLLKRAGTPEEVAQTYLYAASCRYLTATEIILDGGSQNR